MRVSAFGFALLAFAATANAAPDAGPAAAEDEGRHCVAPKELKSELQAPWESACEFFTGVAARDARAVVSHVHAPFYFEAKPAQSMEETARRWVQLLGDAGGGQ